jgi:hypothetical protein
MAYLLKSGLGQTPQSDPGNVWEFPPWGTGAGISGWMVAAILAGVIAFTKAVTR